MRKFALLFVVAALALISCTRINAGYEGIKINQYGDGRGVQDVTIVTGRVFYNPIKYDIVEYPTFYQTADYDPFTVNAKDGPIFEIDPMINFRVKVGQSPRIYVNYRKDLDELASGPLLTIVKNAFKNRFNEYTTDEILSKREEFDKLVGEDIAVEFAKEGFETGQMTFGMRYPETITKAIESKTAAIQRAQQKENELQMARADSAITMTKARAEAAANKLKQTALTDLIIKQMFIDKWDGTSALYNNAPIVIGK